MRTTWIKSIIVIAFLLVFVPHVMADGFDCGSRIIATGDRKGDVLSKCGNPSYVEVREEVRVKRDFGTALLYPDTGLNRFPLFVKELVTVEEWEYNLGPNRFIRYLEFENGRLIRITDGDYGY